MVRHPGASNRGKDGREWRALRWHHSQEENARAKTRQGGSGARNGPTFPPASCSCLGRRVDGWQCYSGKCLTTSSLMQGSPDL